MADSTEYLREIALNIEQLASAIVDEMVRRGVGIGGGGSNGLGDATVAISNTIASNIGSIDSGIARDINEYFDANGNLVVTPWNVNSLLKGILLESLRTSNTVIEIEQSQLPTLLSILSLIYGRLSSALTITPSQINPIDFSGSIQTKDTSIEVLDLTNVPTSYLFIQNHLINPTGDLWFNFNNPASIGSGSICLKPGENYVMEGNSVANSPLNILGTAVGMQYTIKKV